MYKNNIEKIISTLGKYAMSDNKNQALAAKYFKPEEIASALLHLEENAEFYESQTAYGLERVRRFSWENTAREILKIYKEILA